MNLKPILLLLFVQASLITSFAQQPTCESLHTGLFKVYTKESGTTFITRTAKEQRERNDGLGYDIIFSITWTDECTYELRPKKLIRGEPSIMGDGSSVVKTKIRGITEKSYIAETTANFSDGKTNFLVEIIK